MKEKNCVKESTSPSFVLFYKVNWLNVFALLKKQTPKHTYYKNRENSLFKGKPEYIELSSLKLVITYQCFLPLAVGLGDM